MCPPRLFKVEDPDPGVARVPQLRTDGCLLSLREGVELKLPELLSERLTSWDDASAASSLRRVGPCGMRG